MKQKSACSTSDLPETRRVYRNDLSSLNIISVDWSLQASTGGDIQNISITFSPPELTSRAASDGKLVRFSSSGRHRTIGLHNDGVELHGSRPCISVLAKREVIKESTFYDDLRFSGSLEMLVNLDPTKQFLVGVGPVQVTVSILDAVDADGQTLTRVLHLVDLD